MNSFTKKLFEVMEETYPIHLDNNELSDKQKDILLSLIYPLDITQINIKDILNTLDSYWLNLENIIKLENVIDNYKKLNDRNIPIIISPFYKSDTDESISLMEVGDKGILYLNSIIISPKHFIYLQDTERDIINSIEFPRNADGSPNFEVIGFSKKCLLFQSANYITDKILTSCQLLKSPSLKILDYEKETSTLNLKAIISNNQFYKYPYKSKFKIGSIYHTNKNKIYLLCNKECVYLIDTFNTSRVNSKMLANSLKDLVEVTHQNFNSFIINTIKCNLTQ